MNTVYEVEKLQDAQYVDILKQYNIKFKINVNNVNVDLIQLLLGQIRLMNL